jgi:hypothetical protein
MCLDEVAGVVIQAADSFQPAAGVRVGSHAAREPIPKLGNLVLGHQVLDLVPVEPVDRTGRRCCIDVALSAHAIAPPSGVFRSPDGDVSFL